MVETMENNNAANGSANYSNNKNAAADSSSDDENSRGRPQVHEPMDLLQVSLGSPILVKLRHNRQITGKLVAYDDHLNLMLSDSKEKVMEKVEDGSMRVVSERDMQIIYVRGDLVIMVSP